MANKETNKEEIVTNDLEEVYNQKMKCFTGWGIADNDPVYQQIILEVELILETMID